MISPAPKDKSGTSRDEFKTHPRYKPFKGSSKIYKPGTIHTEIRVPFREIQLSPTVNSDNQKIPNGPVMLYDTSGPYTDSNVAVDISKGLPELRRPWIQKRGDTERLD